MESRMRGDMQVRFGGRYEETYCRKAARRLVPSLRIGIAHGCPDTELLAVTELIEKRQISPRAYVMGLFMPVQAVLQSGHPDTSVHGLMY